MRQFLSLIKWASIQHRENKDEINPQGVTGEEKAPVSKSKPAPFTVKGSGLLVGIVGKRCKFDLFPPVSETLDLLIEVQGPSDMFCSEHITSLFPKSRRNSSASVEPPASREEGGNKLWKNGTSKLLGHDLVGKDGERRRSSDSLDESTKIPFDYKCVGEGQIQVSYVPRSSGQHAVTIKWHNAHIRGSPFGVIVAESIEKLNEECKGIVRHKKVTFDNGEIVVNKSGHGTLTPAVSTEVAVTVEKPSPTSEESPPVPELGVTAAVLSRSSKVQRSISKSGLTTQKLSSQTTVTRRRVLKRIITTGGQEIVIHETCETPISSREGSRDNDSTSSISDSVGSGERRRSVTKRTTSTTKSFDCEISYDSEPNVSAIPSTTNAPIEYLLRRVALEGFIHGIVERIIDNAMKQVHMNNIKRCAEENSKIRSRNSKHKIHPRLGARMSLPIQPFTPGNNLLLPSFDVKFQCSPYTESKEIPPGGREKEKVKDKLSLPHDLHSPDDNSSNGHRKLTATKSDPMTNVDKVSDKEQNKKNFNKWISSWIDAHCPSGKVASNSLFSDHESKQMCLPSETSPTEETDRQLLPTGPTNAEDGQDDSGVSSNATVNDRERDELTRSETETSTESARVTVRTQLKEKKHRARDLDSEKQRKHLNPTSGRACIMDMEPIMSPDYKLSKRSMTLPASKLGEEKAVEDTGETASSSAQTKLKVLQSDSLKKTCCYNSQRALTGSIISSSQSSGPPEQSLDSQQSADLENLSSVEQYSPMLKQTMSKLQLRMSASLPTLSKNWTAFEIDPDDELLSIEEMEALSVAAQGAKKRMTLAESEISEAIAHGIETNDGRESKQIYADMRSMKKQKQDSLGSDLSVPVSTSPNLSVDMNTPYNASPNVSPFSSPATSTMNSRRNSTSRSDVTGLKKVSEEMSSLEDALTGIQPITDFTVSPKVGGFHKPEVRAATTKLMTQPHNVKVTSSSPNLGLNIKVPKATIDRWTQVKYEEIKEATGWVRPTTYVRPRPRIVRNEAVEGSSSVESSGPAAGTGATPSRPNAGIPTIVCQKDEQPGRENKPGNWAPADLRNLLNPDEELLQPKRQSTIDTVDSGIADDNGSTKQAEPPRRPVPTLPTIPPSPTKPRFINGHRAVTRSRYRGKISLDPKLVSGHGSQSTTTSSADDSPHRRKAGLTVMRYARSNSDARKGKRRMLSREESVSDTENRGLRKRQSYRGGCFKRRVTFSRRVLMYRRSSSRNSSRNSRSRDDTMRSSAQSEPSLLEVSESQPAVEGKREPRQKAKSGKPKLRRKAPAESKWLAQLSRESRESMESGSTIERETSWTSVRQTESLPGTSTPNKPPKMVHRRSASTDLIKDFLSATEVSGPAEADSTKEDGQIHSFEGFDGYGLTAEGRKSLLEELDAFSKLSSGTIERKKQKQRKKDYGSSGNESSMEELTKYKQNQVPQNAFTTLPKSECQTPDIVIHSEDSPFSRIILKAEDCVPFNSPSKQQFFGAIDPGSLVDTLEADVSDNEDQDTNIMEVIFGDIPAIDQCPENITIDFIPGIPDPFKCKAFGTGLKLGHVGIKNNFQVSRKLICKQIRRLLVGNVVRYRHVFFPIAHYMQYNNLLILNVLPPGVYQNDR